MQRFEGLHAARGQIAWILALILSTAIVVQLERLDVGSQLTVLAQNPLADAALSHDIALEQARSRAPDPATAAAEDQVNLLLTLAMAANDDPATLTDLRPQADEVVTAIAASDPSDPAVISAMALVVTVFDLR
jgi:hypothetical protein